MPPLIKDGKHCQASRGYLSCRWMCGPACSNLPAAAKPAQQYSFWKAIMHGLKIILTWQDAERVFDIAVQLASNEVHHRGVGVELVHCRHEGMNAILSCKSTCPSAQLSRLKLNPRFHLDSNKMCDTDMLVQSASCALWPEGLEGRHGSSKGTSKQAKLTRTR